MQLFPVQANPRNRQPATAPEAVYMAAYEVYCHVYGPQERLITRNCRGGLASSEIIAFLYARAFPKHEWKVRVEEAFKGLNV